ncbi:hypothetical protein GEMMAAP_13895 [Gemmatimonas phototrophica]|uniref:AB hydrolase-1 domain-containing protein n=2 Tax=Gemmatimonas phototrophica TaxID=1379270 RepID=A0A143BQS1_9BACT|nr:hypothetical protein GEMMAAP_13895 [Gemmatimonas phototrophica]
MTTPDWLDREQWPYHPREYTDPDGRMHYVDEGDGPLIILVHGTPTWSLEWRHVIHALRPQFRLLAVDHLGFGLSERPKGVAYTPEAHAERFRRWHETVVGTLPYAMIVHDFGGPITLPSVLADPQSCRRLIVTNSWGWDMARDPALRRQINLVQGMLGRWLYRYANASQRLLMPKAYGNRAALTPSIHAQYLAPFRDPEARERVLYALARSLKLSAAFFDDLYAKRQRLATVPTHVVWGMKDGTLPPSILDGWRVALPHAVVHPFEESGHWPQEEKPERFTALVRSILTM